MAGQPCANHPTETTFVRCGRCEKPICVRCMVDSPVGKRCRECSRRKTHLTESSLDQVGRAFAAAVLVAIPAGWLAQHFGFILLLGPVYGWLVGEVALRAGGRSRSVAMQAVTGLAALIGAVLGATFSFGGPYGMPPGFVWQEVFRPWAMLLTVLGVVTAVSRVRYL